MRTSSFVGLVMVCGLASGTYAADQAAPSFPTGGQKSAEAVVNQAVAATALKATVAAAEQDALASAKDAEKLPVPSVDVKGSGSSSSSASADSSAAVKVAKNIPSVDVVSTPAAASDQEPASKE